MLTQALPTEARPTPSDQGLIRRSQAPALRRGFFLPGVGILSRSAGVRSRCSNSSSQLQNDDMKRLLLLVPLVLAEPAIAFDGGWYDKEEERELSNGQPETLAKYSEFHQSCMDIQMTMWGEVAELMEDLATAHCYCEYTKLEDLESITWADKNDADIECANQGTISKKEAFIWWALPLHRQRLKDEQK